MQKHPQEKQLTGIDCIRERQFIDKEKETEANCPSAPRLRPLR